MNTTLWLTFCVWFKNVYKCRTKRAPCRMLDSRIYHTQEYYTIFNTLSRAIEMVTANESWSEMAVTLPPIAPVNIIDGYMIRTHISVFFSFPMFVIGMCGNLLTLVVLLSSRSFRSTSFGMLLIALSISDMGLLSTGLLRHCIRGLTWDRVAIRNLCHWCCKVQVYLTYVFVELSPWTLCLVTLERTVAVICPLKTATLCTKRRMLGAWITILVILTSFNAVTINKTGVASSTGIVDANITHSPPPETFTSAGINGTLGKSLKIRDAYCRILSFDDYFMRFVMPITLLLIAYIIPRFAVFIINVILVCQLRRSHKVGMSMRNGRDNHAGRGRNSDTNMLLGIIVLFILTDLPLSLYYVYYHFRTGNHDVKHILYIVTLNMSYINNAFNFVIYCFRGQKFRAALRDLVSCHRKSKGRGRELRVN